VALERFEDTLYHEKENYNPNGQVLETVNGEIRLENVTFGYVPDRPVLKGISLSIPSNSVVAIIGESGSGKTTLANLLAGVYPPTSGKIYVDNTDLLSCNLESYRTKIGYIPQNSTLFANTIQENIAVFRDGVSREQIVESTKIACADNFIDQLPLQYDTEIMNRGAGLSGGQIQRIAIARALINNPPILIMDEATSNLDLITEEAVLNAIHQRRRATTTIIIAHRLNTIKQADKIIILSNGKIVEEGTHKSLIQLDGFYTSMLKRQTGDVFTEA
jgi:ATP-binding cassette subfamily B protein